MNLEIVRRIRGNVHGSVDVTAIEDRVISHPHFQRLRRIRQLAFLSYVFPGATHTRFEHSLGVMHLANIAWHKLKTNQERLEKSLDRYGDYRKIEKSPLGDDDVKHGGLAATFQHTKKIFASRYVLQCLRLAALLHDLGHPPFSHSGERFLPTWDDILRENPNLPDYLREYLMAKDAAAADRQHSGKVRHEILSILLTQAIFSDLFAKEPALQTSIDPRDVISIINHDIQPEPSSLLSSHDALGLCRELVSGELDIDRMDYLLRDSRECGVVYGVFDAERILDSLCVYADEGSLHIAITLSGLAAFEDYLRARHSMYLQLYFHKTSVAAEAMMQHIGSLLVGWSLPASAAAYAACDEYHIGGLMKAEVANNNQIADKDQLIRTIDDLLLHRRLWKRVFEMAGPSSEHFDDAIEKAQSLLTAAQIPFETVSTRSALTRFKPRKNQQKSRNRLRLVKKDARQFPRVFAIEDFSDVIHRKIEMTITRLYVPDTQNFSEAAKKLLLDYS